ncbi:MAG TPA: TetR family transcriptional regulator [Acidimicrobiia bacterium]|nr:TetR family transcriptional regulator [Acidimicrobiia bacterium]
MRLFAARPMSEVTVEQVAAESGVALRTLYRYFATKEEIFAAYPRREAGRLGDRIAARPASEPPFEAVRRAIAETGAHTSREELDQWMRAVINCRTNDRIARVALVAMSTTLSDALAQRVGAEPDDLWPSMAGAMIAAALDVAMRQWLVERGDLLAHQMAALDIVAAGLEHAEDLERPRRPR